MNRITASQIGVTVAAVAALCLTGCSANGVPATRAQTAAADSSPGAPVKVARAETREMPVEIAATGNVEPFSTITVKAQIGGTLVKVPFREGDMIREGDLLFEIDPRPYQEAIRQWEANLARDRALLRQNEATLASAQAQEQHYGVQADRYLKLAEQGIFSHEQAEQMSVELKARRSNVRAQTAGIESLRAVIQADEAALEAAKLNLIYCSIRSPINGRTGQILLKAGNLVKANDVDLVTIHQIQPIYVAFSVPEANLTSIRRRLTGNSAPSVRVSVPSEAPVVGKLSFIDNSVDQTTGTVRLKATFANADHRLWPGQFVDVSMQLEQRSNVIAVPAAAIQTGQAGNFVYVLKSDSTVEMRPVTAGARFGTMAAIETGVQNGEQVVTDGHLRLAGGTKVRVLQ
jgi:membrane fusion protein, multidrug efflux system